MFERNEANVGHWSRSEGDQSLFDGQFLFAVIIGRAAGCRADRGGRRNFGRGNGLGGFDEFGAFAAAGDELTDAFLEFLDLLPGGFDFFGEL